MPEVGAEMLGTLCQTSWSLLSSPEKPREHSGHRFTFWLVKGESIASGPPLAPMGTDLQFVTLCSGSLYLCAWWPHQYLGSQDPEALPDWTMGHFPWHKEDKPQSSHVLYTHKYTNDTSVGNNKKLEPTYSAKSNDQYGLLLVNSYVMHDIRHATSLWSMVNRYKASMSST